MDSSVKNVATPVGEGSSFKSVPHCTDELHKSLTEIDRVNDVRTAEFILLQLRSAQKQRRMDNKNTLSCSSPVGDGSSIGGELDNNMVSYNPLSESKRFHLLPRSGDVENGTHQSPGNLAQEVDNLNLSPEEQEFQAAYRNHLNVALFSKDQAVNQFSDGIQTEMCDDGETSSAVSGPRNLDRKSIEPSDAAVKSVGSEEPPLGGDDEGGKSLTSSVDNVKGTKVNSSPNTVITSPSPLAFNNAHTTPCTLQHADTRDSQTTTIHTTVCPTVSSVENVGTPLSESHASMLSSHLMHHMSPGYQMSPGQQLVDLTIERNKLLESNLSFESVLKSLNTKLSTMKQDFNDAQNEIEAKNVRLSQMEVLALLQEKEIERLRSELAGIHENVTAKEQKRSSDISDIHAALNAQFQRLKSDNCDTKVLNDELLLENKQLRREMSAQEIVVTELQQSVDHWTSLVYQLRSEVSHMQTMHAKYEEHVQECMKSAATLSENTMKSRVLKTVYVCSAASKPLLMEHAHCLMQSCFQLWRLKVRMLELLKREPHIQLRSRTISSNDSSLAVHSDCNLIMGLNDDDVPPLEKDVVVEKVATKSVLEFSYPLQVGGFILLLALWIPILLLWLV